MYTYWNSGHATQNWLECFHAVSSRIHSHPPCSTFGLLILMGMIWKGRDCYVMLFFCFLPYHQFQAKWLANTGKKYMNNEEFRGFFDCRCFLECHCLLCEFCFRCKVWLLIVVSAQAYSVLELTHTLPLDLFWILLKPFSSLTLVLPWWLRR